MSLRLFTTLRPVLIIRLLHARLFTMTAALPNVKPTTLGKSEVYDEQPMKEGKWIGVQELKVSSSKVWSSFFEWSLTVSRLGLTFPCPAPAPPH